MGCKDKKVDTCPTTIVGYCDKVGLVVDGNWCVNCSRDGEDMRNKLKKAMEAVKSGQNPGIVRKAMNLTGAIARSGQMILRGERVRVTDEEKAARWTICLDCQHLLHEKTCRYCGCNMKLKTRWASETCPLNKWTNLDK